MLSQEGNSCVWNRPGFHHPAGPAGWGSGWPARGGKPLGSRSLISFFLSLSSFLIADASLLTFFFFFFLLAGFTDPSANLLVLFISRIFSCSYTPTPRDCGRGGSKFPTGHRLPSSCGWFHIIFVFSGLLPQRCGGTKLPRVIGLGFLYLSAPHSSSPASLPLSPPPHRDSPSHLESQFPLPLRGSQRRLCGSEYRVRGLRFPGTWANGFRKLLMVGDKGKIQIANSRDPGLGFSKYR